jgi:signal transduction histidine kinase
MMNADTRNGDLNEFTISTNDLLARKANQLHLTILLIIGIYAITYTILDYLDGNFRELWLDFLIIPCVYIALILFKMGYALISKLTTIVLMTTIISVFSLLTCQETAVLTFFIPIFIGILIIFQGKERFWGYIFVGINMLVLIFLLTTDIEPWGPNPASQSTIQTEWTLNTIGASFLAILEVIFILKINNSFQADLIEKSNTLNETNFTLQAAVKSREKMMSVLSHDMRSPLLVLLSSVEILSSEKESPEVKTMLLTELKKRIKHTITFIDNMLLWARNQSDSIKANKEEISLPIINEFLENYCRLLSHEKNIEFNIIVPLEGSIFVDINIIQAIFRNLISNAYKFTAEGGKINIAIAQANDFYKIQVEDTGKGISPENVQKLLHSESFSTLGTAREKGHGFGIQLVNDFIKAIGSELHIESTEGTGSRFYFFIPVH